MSRRRRVLRRVLVTEHPTILGAADLRSVQGRPAPRFSARETTALRAAKKAVAALPPLLGPHGSGLGSNSWVVSGEHTATGKPLLANDPHLGPALPSVWTQMGLHCAPVTSACPYDVAGFTFSAVPGVVIGHDADIAWGFTNLAPDVADLYLEQVDGDGHTSAGKHVPLTTRRETIRVAGANRTGSPCGRPGTGR